MKEKVTIIIPVYNCVSFLEASINSALNQTWDNLQILLIDDGSEDGSEKICDIYARNNANIAVFHQKNSGVSAARNLGLRNAVGEYITFLDADDVLPKDTIESQIGTIKGYDLVIGGHQEIDKANQVIASLCPQEDKDLSADEMLYYLFDESEYGYQGFICSKLFRTEIIKHNNINFDEKIKYNEDRLFITQYLLQCSRVVLNKHIVYQYRKHQASVMGAVESKNIVFKPAMLTELLAFEKMMQLVKIKNPELAIYISRLTFEKALYWLKYIDSSQYLEEKKIVRKIMQRNAGICIKKSNKGSLYKIKILIHCILEK